jgi:hypothetical protein
MAVMAAVSSVLLCLSQQVTPAIDSARGCMHAYLYPCSRLLPSIAVYCSSISWHVVFSNHMSGIVYDWHRLVVLVATDYGLVHGHIRAARMMMLSIYYAY